MSRLPIVDAKTMEKVLLLSGFNPTRQKGSHRFYRHPDGRVTTVPHHPGRDLSRPLTRKILTDAKIETEEFTQILKKI